MTSKELRQKYIEFFKKKGHSEIPSASLIPENDPSTLFISAGMQPLAPFLLGEKHPAGKRLVNSQKCLRTDDINEIGDKSHLTFFEMLGHWSLNDYWKEEAIKMSYEFLTDELELDPKYLSFSVFGGNQNVPKDKETAGLWIKLGIAESRIAYLSKENWWEPAGSSGPCGPCTEMFYWTGGEPVPKKFDPQNKYWVEIGNDVLMEYEKIGENKYQLAKQKNIDNGTGFERLLAVINGLDDNYLTDLFLPIINKIEELSGKRYGENEENTKSMRIIADHLRAAAFIMGDDFGVAPSNVDRGYIVRKLIRRAIRHGKLLGINGIFCFKIAEIVIKIMQDVYPELKKNRDFIIEQSAQEEEKFERTLDKALKLFHTKIEAINFGKDNISSNVSKKHAPLDLTGKFLFDMFQTYGFPLEMSLEELKRNGKNLSDIETEKLISEFNQELKKHQELSRTAAAGKFKGGLANQSEQVVKYHTATHLLLAALRKILGNNVFQKGSNLTEKRLRLDFSYPKKLTDEQKDKVERLVNKWIAEDLPVKYDEMTLEQAKAKQAMGVFENKYGDKVKVYTIGEDGGIVSREICGGPHVKRTGMLGRFRIVKEESSSAGVRRIKAVLE